MRIMIRGLGAAVLLFAIFSSHRIARAESLEEGFAKPPAAAMPGVWWRMYAWLRHPSRVEAQPIPSWEWRKDSPVNGTSSTVFRPMSDS